MGAIARGRCKSGSPLCGNTTCMHHMRGGMGSGETCTRPEENQIGQDDGQCHKKGRQSHGGSYWGLGGSVGSS
jgi:hypothetical protein